MQLMTVEANIPLIKVKKHKATHKRVAFFFLKISVHPCPTAIFRCNIMPILSSCIHHNSAVTCLTYTMLYDNTPLNHTRRENMDIYNLSDVFNESNIPVLTFGGL